MVISCLISHSSQQATMAYVLPKTRIWNKLDPLLSPIVLDPSHFCGWMCEGKSETDTNCWTSPNGRGFMIRGKTYLKDNTKVPEGDPLLELIAFKVDHPVNKVALHPKCLVKIDAGKKLPLPADHYRYYPRKQCHDWGEQDPFESIWVEPHEDVSTFSWED